MGACCQRECVHSACSMWTFCAIAKRDAEFDAEPKCDAARDAERNSHEHTRPSLHDVVRAEQRVPRCARRRCRGRARYRQVAGRLVI